MRSTMQLPTMGARTQRVSLKTWGTWKQAMAVGTGRCTGVRWLWLLW